MVLFYSDGGSMTRRQYMSVLLVAAITGLLGGGLMNWFGSRVDRAIAEPSRMVTASEFRLIDGDGRTRALLSLLRGKPRLIMTDEKGEFRIELGLGVDGQPALWLRDQDGKARAQIGLTGTGSPGLELTDGRGRNRTSLGLASNGEPSLLLRDDTGRERLALWQEKGELGLALADKDGRPRAGLAMKEGRNPSLAFYDPKGGLLWHAP
jgi:hypothetical protein